MNRGSSGDVDVVGHLRQGGFRANDLDHRVAYHDPFNDGIDEPPLAFDVGGHQQFAHFRALFDRLGLRQRTNGIGDQVFIGSDLQAESGDFVLHSIKFVQKALAGLHALVSGQIPQIVLPAFGGLQERLELPDARRRLLTHAGVHLRCTSNNFANPLRRQQVRSDFINDNIIQFVTSDRRRVSTGAQAGMKFGRTLIVVIYRASSASAGRQLHVAAARSASRNFRKENVAGCGPGRSDPPVALGKKPLDVLELGLFDNSGARNLDPL